MATIPTISLYQPWASLWVHGKKLIETRSWAWKARLPSVLAVHAAKRWTRDQEDLCGEDPFHPALLACGYADGRRLNGDALPRGAVVGLVRLVECVPAGQVSFLSTDEPPCWFKDGLYRYLGLGPTERAFGDYSPGRFAWLTDRRLAFAEPLPLRGFQSVWQWAPPQRILDLAEELRQS